MYSPLHEGNNMILGPERLEWSQEAHLAFDLVLLVSEAPQHSTSAGLASEEAAGIAAEIINVRLTFLSQPVIQPAMTIGRCGLNWQ